MDRESLIKELWSTANVITGFAIIQTITFTYACSKSGFQEAIAEVHTKITISIILIIITIAQSYAVIWCGKKQIELINKLNESSASSSDDLIEIMKKSSYGRALIIVFLLIVALISLYAKPIGETLFK